MRMVAVAGMGLVLVLVLGGAKEGGKGSEKAVPGREGIMTWKYCRFSSGPPSLPGWVGVPVRRGMSGARERAGSGKGGNTSRGMAPGAWERAWMKWMRMGAWLSGGVMAVRNWGRWGLVLNPDSVVRQE